MNKFIVVFLFAACLFSSACKLSCRKEKAGGTLSEPLAGTDTAFLYFDAQRITDLLRFYRLDEKHRQDVDSFYISRNNEFAWINTYGINEYGRNLLNLLNHEERSSGDECILFAERLESFSNQLSREGYSSGPRDSATAELELLLTINFFEYARRNWQGLSDEEIRGVGWFIERKKLNYQELLDTLLNQEPGRINSFEPVYAQYGLLKVFLRKYNELEKSGGWKFPAETMYEFRTGDTSSVIVAVKRQLYLLEDLPRADSSILFDGELETAVRRFQKRHGLREDGLLSKLTMKEMFIPVRERIRQILINMERCRWVPEEQSREYLVVNIPDFKLFMVRNDSLAWSCNVIVGKTQVTHNTVIFNDEMETIVFSPYWNIPGNILTKETLPAIKRDPGYLAKHDMEVVDGSGRQIQPASINWENYTTDFPYIIRQRPGINNALGLVKFLFPNSYDIYIHDTPEKSLFGETRRTFSHGCIRLEEPYKLARYLLRDEPGWTPEKINRLLYGGRQTFVKLKQKVPVFIAYFTAWVDLEGKLNFREDVYHHDEKMKPLLFSDGN